MIHPNPKASHPDYLLLDGYLCDNNHPSFLPYHMPIDELRVRMAFDYYTFLSGSHTVDEWTDLLRYDYIGICKQGGIPAEEANTHLNGYEFLTIISVLPVVRPDERSV